MSPAPTREGMDSTWDYVIVGAGPGGVQLGYFFEKYGCSYKILEASLSVGSFFQKMPRRRELISFNRTSSIYDDAEIRLRWDWNSLLTDDYSFPFRKYSRRLYPQADELVRYLQGYAAHHDLAIQLDTRVCQATRLPQGGFLLQDQHGRSYRCRALILATGFSEAFVPDIPGIDLCEKYENAPMDPDAYEGQRVLFIGKGNSAFEVADLTIETAALVHLASPRPVQLAWNTRHPGHVRANHARLLDTYQLKTLHSALDCHVQRIVRDGDEFVVSVSYTHAESETEDLVYDRVVCCTGFKMKLDFCDESCQPEEVLEGRLPNINGMWESRNVSDLFFAGTLMQSLDFKRSSSAFIDGFRYNIRTLFHHLRERYEGQPYPARKLEAAPHSLMPAVISRVCRTSALWTQFGYLCDLLLVDEHGGTIEWREELSLPWVAETYVKHPHYYTITFEWGAWRGDVFNIERHPRAEMADASVFLHPIVRRYRGSEVVEAHHLLEDLFGTYSGRSETGVARIRAGRDLSQWHWDEHEKPLLEFFTRHLARGQGFGDV